jgi:enoyl-CoA hydratase/carnithine racemase
MQLQIFKELVAIADRVAACAPLSIRTALTSAHLAIDPTEDPALAALNAQRSALYRTADFQEGLAAAREHRTPHFEGQ